MDVLINTISASEAQFTYINPYYGLAENYVPFVTSTGCRKATPLGSIGVRARSARKQRPGAHRTHFLSSHPAAASRILRHASAKYNCQAPYHCEGQSFDPSV